MADDALATVPLDHIGMVLSDLAPAVERLRLAGFQVSNPVALFAGKEPMGQMSAHCVFDNTYIELSAPFAGTGNHLEPLLEQGAGVRIVVLACDDVETEQARLADEGHATGPMHEISRVVVIDRKRKPVRGRWFQLPEAAEGTLVAALQHRDPSNAWHPRLREHPNGAGAVSRLTLGSNCCDLARFANPALKSERLLAELDPDLPPAHARMWIDGIGEPVELGRLTLLPTGAGPV